MSVLQVLVTCKTAANRYQFMNKSYLRQKCIAVGAAVSTAFLTAPALMANESAEGENADIIEEVVVYGIRGSLQRSMEMKRNATGVVDGISAEEMGKFPDTNLAEALQRITGVSISRTNGEGSQITVRGFGPSFNLVTLNGRQMPATGKSRSYNLENLSSEGVDALQVQKTARASTPSGGLGATVNIVTTKPLDAPGQQGVFVVKANHDVSNVEGDDVTPEIAGVYKNTLMDDKFGVGLSFSHYRRDFQQQSSNIQGWQANVDLPTGLDPDRVIDPRSKDDEGKRIGNHFFPRDVNYRINDLQRERNNAQLTLQFAPIDALTATVDYTLSEATTGSNSIAWGMWNEYGGNINAYELDADGTAVRAEISGNDGSYTAQRSTTFVDAESIGFNLQWQFSDTLELSFDYHDSSNATDNGADTGLRSDGSLVVGSDQLNTKYYDYRSGEVPQMLIDWKNGGNVLPRGDIDSHFSQFVHSPGKSEVEQFQLDGVWIYGGSALPLVDVSFGLGRVDQTLSGSSRWSGLIGGFLFNPSYTAVLPDSMFTYNSTGDFLDAFDGGGADLHTNYYYTFDFDELAAISQAFLTNEVLGGKDYFALSANHPLGTFTSDGVQEVTDSIYVESSWEFDVAGLPVSLNAGIRYEETDVTSRVLQNIPTAVWWKGGSEFLTQYAGESIRVVEGGHDLLLPMLDIRVDITDELIGRVSWGKSITRAPLGDLIDARILSGSPKVGSRSGDEGNTNLQPYEATNLDLSLEWYFGEDSYLSIGYYKKSIENWIERETQKSTIEGFHDVYKGPRWLAAEASLADRNEQATNTAIFTEMVAQGAVVNEGGFIEPTAADPLIVWDIKRPLNLAETRSVDGFEVAVQHVFGESGFGLSANATTVNGDVEFDVDSLEQQAPLTGLSDSANFQAFYEKHGLSVKVTYAWRDSYLIGVGQSQGSSDNPPQFAKEFGQIDASINYDLDDYFTVFLDGINLNNETEQGYGRYERQFLFARQYGPRYTLGVRYIS
jgi:iron complex outermembrane receptor protein